MEPRSFGSLKIGENRPSASTAGEWSLHSFSQIVQSSRVVQPLPDTEPARVAVNAAHALGRNCATSSDPFATGVRPVDNTSRTPTTEVKKPTPAIGGVPVLAQLPLVSPGRPIASNTPAATRNLGRRFDPPQAERRTAPRATSSENPTTFPKLKSELVYSPESARPPQPHVFEWARTREQRKQSPRSESRHLPRSNPYQLPRRSLLETLAPVMRFVVIVALFTAAGTWFQMSAIRKRHASEDSQPAKTANQPASPANDSLGRPAQAPTAIGPVSSPPESNTKIGRIRDSADYARLRGDILPSPSSSSSAESSHELAASRIPHVQNYGTANRVAENTAPNANHNVSVAKNSNSTTAESAGTTARSASAPEVARAPGSGEIQAK